jgi:hypothetical protein
MPQILTVLITNPVIIHNPQLFQYTTNPNNNINMNPAIRRDPQLLQYTKNPNNINN